jgi:rRNA pseudouridine-1189 N-methylase Emg1 (Nep1/Mra1 family)
MLFLVLVTAISQSTYANGDDWVKLDQKGKAKTPKLEQQKMEPKPSSVVGGAKSGDSKKETDQERMRHDAEKQKQLYEYEGYYRKGI